MDGCQALIDGWKTKKPHSDVRLFYCRPASADISGKAVHLVEVGGGQHLPDEGLAALDDDFG